MWHTDKKGDFYVTPYEIHKVSALERRHKMYATFSPALPDIASLKNDISIDGCFGIGVDKTADIVQGVYQIRCKGSRVHTEMHPDKNWKPRGNLLVKLTFLFFPPVFRTWVRTYRWSAVIEIDRESPKVTMKSGWQRNFNI